MKPNILTEGQLSALYSAFLDELYPAVSIAGTEYNTSRLLKIIDPTAYRCGLADWVDNEISEGRLEENEKGSISLR